MNKIEAKNEIIEILERDGIVYEHSTKNTERVMSISEEFREFSQELMEMFPEDVGVIHEEITTKGFEGWQRAYFLYSRMSRECALELFKQFYEIFAK